jgi:hypothetical protein
MGAGSKVIIIQSLQSGADGCKLEDRTTAHLKRSLPLDILRPRSITIHDNLCIKEKTLSTQLPRFLP